MSTRGVWTTREPDRSSTGSASPMLAAACKDGCAMPNVFISYSREGSPTAQRLAADLERAGMSVFLDTEGMRAGSFAEQLDQAIARCDVFVLLISTASVRSTYVLRELHVQAAATGPGVDRVEVAR